MKVIPKDLVERRRVNSMFLISKRDAPNVMLSKCTYQLSNSAQKKPFSTSSSCSFATLDTFKVTVSLSRVLKTYFRVIKAISLGNHSMCHAFKITCCY